MLILIEIHVLGEQKLDSYLLHGITHVFKVQVYYGNKRFSIN